MRTAALADVCGITMGQAPKGDTYNDLREGIPLVAGAGDFGDVHPKPKKYTTARKVRLAQPGDIILGIRASIGDKVLADDVYCLGRGVAGLRAGPEIDGRYLWHWVTHAAPALAAKGRGATFLQVNKQDVSEMPVPLPPIEEQRRIAAILDEADALRAKRRRAVAKLDTLTQAIFIDMFGDPLAQSEGLVPLSEVVLLQRGFDLPVAQREEGSVPVWAANGPVGTHSVARVPGPGVVTGRSGTIGRVHYVEADFWPLNTALFVKDFFGNDPVYICWLLKNIRLERFSRGVGVPTLNRNLVHESRVVVHPVESQRRFSDRVAGLDEFFSKLRFQSLHVDTLFASLQQRAFRGDL